MRQQQHVLLLCAEQLYQLLFSPSFGAGWGQPVCSAGSGGPCWLPVARRNVLFEARESQRDHLCHFSMTTLHSFCLSSCSQKFPMHCRACCPSLPPEPSWPGGWDLQSLAQRPDKVSAAVLSSASQRGPCGCMSSIHLVYQ